MLARNIAERIGPEVAAPRPLVAQIQRLEQTLEECERRLEAQASLIEEAVLAGRDTEQDIFDLQKMQLVVAILREGRDRLLERPPQLG